MNFASILLFVMATTVIFSLQLGTSHQCKVSSSLGAEWGAIVVTARQMFV
jgi:hypothetical protein